MNDGHDIKGVSCPSETLCVVVAGGNVITSTDPTGGASEWTSTELAIEKGSYLTGVSCSSTNFCLAVDAGGDVVTSTDPTGGAAAWSVANVDSHLLDEPSCVPSGGLCVVGASEGSVITSTDPMGGAGAWTRRHLDIGSNYLEGVSCVSVSLCVAVGTPGNVVVSTDPTSEGGAWIEMHVDEHELNAVSCPSVGLCVAVDQDGGVVTSSDPTGGAGAWSVADVDGAIPLRGVSCASVRLCVAIDGEGDVVTSSDPTGGAGAWSVASVSGSNLQGVSCPSEELCVLTNGERDTITSTDPTGGAGAWSTRYVGAYPSISCPSVSLCVTVGDGSTPVISWGEPTSGAWRETRIAGPQIEGLGGLDEVSCDSADFCVATSYGGGGAESGGDVIVSSDPTGGVGACSESNIYGPPVESADSMLSLGSDTEIAPLGPDNEIPPLGPDNEIPPFIVVTTTGVSCAPGVCVVLGTGGMAMVGTPPAAPVNTGPPVLSGTPVVGDTLSCSNGSWTGSPAPVFAYEWLRDGAAIVAADGDTYVVQAADEGSGLVCEVTAANNMGWESARSAALQIPVAQTPSGGGEQTPSQ
ncbi:MAG: hypothetical protein WCC64_05445, partial [Aliidongia sp.]